MPAASGQGTRASGPLWMLLGLSSVVLVIWHLAVLMAFAMAGTPGHPRMQDSLSAILTSPLNPLAGYHQTVPSAWLVWPLFLLGMALVTVTAWWWWSRRNRQPKRQGIGTTRQLRPYLSESAQRLLAAQTRPRMVGRDTADIEDLAVNLGRAEDSMERLFGSHEDSYAVIGGPRSRKTATYLADAVRTGPGPTVAVSTKSDLLTSTYKLRRRRGLVLVLDPTNVLNWPWPLRWDLVVGCEDPDAAMARAEGLVAAVPKSTTTTNSDFFESQARDVLRCFLHAAALVGTNMREVIEWCYRLDSPTLRPREILRTHPQATPLYALELEALTSGDAKEGPLDSTKKTLQRLVAPFASPRVLAAFTPAPGEGFDIEAFLDSSDTLYVLAGEGETVAPLVTAFVNDIIRVARKKALRLTPARLDPPLRLVIDEVAGVCPLPDLPGDMSDTGGRGITMVIGSQGLGQARARWGADGAAEVFGSATAKIIMGGTSEPDFLEDMSRLAGEVEVVTNSTTVTEGGGSSATTASRDRRVLRPDEIRTLPPGSALVLYRQAPPVVAQFPVYWESSWAKDAIASQEEVAALIAGGSQEPA